MPEENARPVVAPVAERPPSPDVAASESAASDATAGDGLVSRKYLGPASSFRAGRGAKAIGPGDEVTLSEAQYEQLTRLGHSFDPPWTPPAPRELDSDEDELTV